MIGMCSPWQRKYAKPDDSHLGATDGGAPEPHQKTRARAERSLAWCAAPLELTFEPFAIGRDRGLRGKRRMLIGVLRHSNRRREGASVPRTRNQHWRAAASRLLKKQNSVLRRCPRQRLQRSAHRWRNLVAHDHALIFDG